MNILYHDNDIAVCIKPVGLDSEHDLPAALSEVLGGEFFAVHRLDKNVGGVMVYAANKTAATELSEVIRQGKMTKEYYALVHGIPPKSGIFEDLLWKDSRKNRVYTVNRMRAGVKRASLEYTCLTDSDPALVRIRLHTGRSHQIRVQFASRGFPLVGDGKYGAKDNCRAPYLFSCCLTFTLFGKELSFSAQPDWQVFVKAGSEII